MPHPDTDDLDDGTLEAFLDGALPAEEVRRVETQLAASPALRARLAAARAIRDEAAALLALVESVPLAVWSPPMRERADGGAPGPGRGPRARRPRAWYDQPAWRWAAGVLLVAGAAWVVRPGANAPRSAESIAMTAPAAPTVPVIVDSSMADVTATPAPTTMGATTSAVATNASPVTAPEARRAERRDLSRPAVPAPAPDTRVASGERAPSPTNDAGAAPTPVAREQQEAALAQAAPSASARAAQLEPSAVARPTERAAAAPPAAAPPPSPAGEFARAPLAKATTDAAGRTDVRARAELNEAAADRAAPLAARKSAIAAAAAPAAPAGAATTPGRLITLPDATTLLGAPARTLDGLTPRRVVLVRESPPLVVSDYVLADGRLVVLEQEPAPTAAPGIGWTDGPLRLRLTATLPADSLAALRRTVRPTVSP